MMFSSEVLPQPLGPTTAMNSPSATDNETSSSAGASVPSRSSQYRLETWLTSSFTMHRAYRKAALRLRSCSALIDAPNVFSKNPSFTNRST